VTNVHTSRRRGMVQLSAWFAIAALAWQAIRSAARARRLEHVTRAWQVTGPPTTNAGRHR
jgi:hypothetical protein